MVKFSRNLAHLGLSKDSVQRAKADPVSRELFIGSAGYHIDFPDGMGPRQPTAQHKMDLIQLYLGMRVTLEIDGVISEVPDGSAMWIPAHRTYQWQPHVLSRSARSYWINIEGQSVESLRSMCGWDIRRPYVQVSDATEWVSIHNEIVKTMSVPASRTSVFEISTLALFLMQRLAKSQRSVLRFSKPAEERVYALIEQLKAEVIQKQSLSELSARVDLSTPHFIHLFKKATGHPPMKYLDQLKTIEATKFLMGTSASVGEIADHLGFEDPLYFSRWFKKQTGSAPSVFRKEQSTMGDVFAGG